MKLRFRLGPVTQKPLTRVNERQKIRHYRARSTEEEEEEEEEEGEIAGVSDFLIRAARP